MGLLLLCVYMLLLRHISRKYGPGFYCYADDTQIYISAKPDVTDSSLIFSVFLRDINSWLQHNLLLRTKPILGSIRSNITTILHHLHRLLVLVE